MPKGVNKDDMIRQLEAFKNLLMNKKFVHTMVKTLESNPQKFGIPDRYSFSTYIMYRDIYMYTHIPLLHLQQPYK